MANPPMRLRAQLIGAQTLVRVMMQHEMESGQRKDESGRIVPAWHIQTVQVALNGQQVMQAEWGPSVSKNPFWQLTLLGARVGDLVSVTWQDNRGEQQSGQTTVV